MARGGEFAGLIAVSQWGLSGNYSAAAIDFGRSKRPNP
jgi:hypothetical protein